MFYGTIILWILTVASVFQATSLINFNSGGTYYPVSPVYICEICLAFLLCVRLAINQVVSRPPSKALRSSVLVLLFFSAYSVLTSLILPYIFQGIPVFSPKLGIDAQVGNLTPLAPTLSVLGQDGYLLLNVLTVLAILSMRRNYAVVARLHGAVTAATVTTIVFGCWQFISNRTGIYFPDHLLYTTKAGYIGDEQVFAGFHKVNSTFTEPSYFGLFLLSVFAYHFKMLLARVTASRVILLIFIVLMAALCGSSTVYLGFLFFFIFLNLKYFGQAILRRKKISRMPLLFIAYIAPMMAALVIATYFSSDTVNAIVNTVLLNKASSLSFFNRQASNMSAARIVVETYGLGVGLGGNRPSSFLFYLISNVGVLGFVLFFLFIALLSKASKVAANAISTESPIQSTRIGAAVWALWFCLLGMAISVPEISALTFWMWVYVVVAYIHHSSAKADVRREYLL